jgi:hypothetical protein
MGWWKREEVTEEELAQIEEDREVAIKKMDIARQARQAEDVRIHAERERKKEEFRLQHPKLRDLGESAVKVKDWTSDVGKGLASGAASVVREIKEEQRGKKKYPYRKPRRRYRSKKRKLSETKTLKGQGQQVENLYGFTRHDMDLVGAGHELDLVGQQGEINLLGSDQKQKDLLKSKKEILLHSKKKKLF